ncbi:MAG: hypothetical protein WA676_09385 [Candidatus Sulfotelmatobacter sp.]
MFRHAVGSDGDYFTAQTFTNLVTFEITKSSNVLCVRQSFRSVNGNR